VNEPGPTLAGATFTPAFAQSATKEPPPGFNDQKPLRHYWGKRLSEVMEVDLKTVAPELRRTIQAAHSILRRTSPS